MLVIMQARRKGRGSRDIEVEDDSSGSNNEDDVWR
jgi:hypothetical protein